MDNAEGSSATLSAVYHSPSGDKAFRHSTPLPQPGRGRALDVQAKTKYLADLRASGKKLQEEINKFLTEKMEEDRTGVSQQKAGDELEEENYGEETVEDEN
ncbi:hypothetical protein A1O3_07838 [Capronia epimyces CBS 606.96]|uniref:EKC/KEOPS complex subunit GON7 n=1 Tax=Capronia epimyces CBS 606.96 TaxID=1182542 RepID=W9YB10_9EURO|nr:uncharacterized protein A1O3_07838 [Capronia epimyces CBS 606.96]EXJ79559.1 hypothetical protein A1O3_07838 [Capronia epimyces CBS 606.96]